MLVHAGILAAALLAGAIFLLVRAPAQKLHRIFKKVVKRLSKGLLPLLRIGAWLMFRFLNARVVPIPITRIVIVAAANIIVAFVLSFFPFSKNLLILCSAFAVLNVLVIGARLMMTFEEIRVVEGFLDASNAKFRGYASALPAPIVAASALALTLAVPPLLANIDAHWPRQFFKKLGNETMDDWALFFIGDILGARPFLDRVPDFLPWTVPSPSIETVGFLGQLISYIAYGLIFVFIYQAAASIFRMSALKRTLLDAVEDQDDANINIIKAKIALMPPWMKGEVLRLALDHPDEEVRDVATDLIARMRIFGFLGIRLYNLHTELSEKVKARALGQILKILRRPDTRLANLAAKKFLRHAQHQAGKRRRYHGTDCLALLGEIIGLLTRKIEPRHARTSAALAQPAE